MAAARSPAAPDLPSAAPRNDDDDHDSGDDRRGKSGSTLSRNIIILACAVDAADKALLPSTFKALDDQFHLGPSKLAALSFAQNVAFSLALPAWGSLMRYHAARDLMVCGCVGWALATFALAAASSYEVQFLLRLVVGAALASVNPLGQAMLCDIIPENERGSAFGWLQSISGAMAMIVSFSTTWAASQEFWGISGWRIAHFIVACLSLWTALSVRRFVIPTPPIRLQGTTWLKEQVRVLREVRNKPSFYIMVAQGVTGGVPWNAFAFLTFYFQLSGYPDLQAGQIMLLGGVGGFIGGILGGNLGDLANARLCGPAGRCAVAQTSVVLGTGAFLWMIYVPFGPGSFAHVVFAAFVFNFVAVWTQPAALRPICGEIFRSSHDRAQVLALWIALEGVISSMCGAPLAGVLSEAFGYRLHSDASRDLPMSDAEREQSRDALRMALVGVSIIPWLLCALAWVPMYWTYPRDRQRAKDEASAARCIGASRSVGASAVVPSETKPTTIGAPKYEAVPVEDL